MIVSKNNLVNATLDEIDFSVEWTIPMEKIKASKEGVGKLLIVYLLQQTIDLFM